jgi:Immunity protein 63
VKKNEEILSEINLLATHANLPTLFENTETAIDITADGIYTLTYFERKSIVSQNNFTDCSELIFQYFYDITSDSAQKFELENRVDGQDSRRLKNQKHIEFMTEVKADWKQKTEKKIRHILEKHPYSDGFVFKNILSVMLNFTQKHRILSWSKIISESIVEWENSKTTKKFEKAAEKQDFFNAGKIPPTGIEETLLTMYLYWLKKSALSFCNYGLVEFPEYKKNLIWGRHCEYCGTSQTGLKQVNQNIAVNIIEKIFKQNLPYEERLSFCDVQQIAESAELTEMRNYLIKFLPTQLIEILQNDSFNLEKCINCKKKNFQSSWSIVKTDDGGHYLQANN